MKKLPQISEAEYEVMKAVWRYAPVTTNEVTDRMLQIMDWSPKNGSDTFEETCDKRSAYI